MCRIHLPQAERAPIPVRNRSRGIRSHLCTKDSSRPRADGVSSLGHYSLGPSVQFVKQRLQLSSRTVW